LKVCIHRGAKEIGGTCVEIESQGKRLVLDVGLPLDAANPDDLALHPINGFAAPDPSLLSVVISHPHQDHYGLAYRLPVETPFMIGKAAEAILNAASLFSPAGLKLKSVQHMTDRVSVVVGPFTITPFLVDHSAYDAYAILVEADGKRLFYSGDFRAHGRKAILVERLIASPPPNVNVLLMEGTCIGRGNEDQAFQSEDDLVPQFAEFFRQTSGMPLVWASGQNIDRIVTIFKACRRAGRQFIIDMYTAEVLRATDNPSLPQAHWDGIRVFLPSSQRGRIIAEGAFNVTEHYKPLRIFSEELTKAVSRYVMLFRPSMVRDVERANCLTGGSLINSVWAGYLESDKSQWFVEWLEDQGLRVHSCHTSGHASVTDLRRLRNAFADAIVVPVHLSNRKRFGELFNNVQAHDDGEWWEVR
jgi:ribonuclease J